MAAVTRSVGKTGRDYSSLGAAIAAYGTDFVTGDDVTLLEYNDDGGAITESAITIPDLGGVGSLTIKPAPGTGALGHPNDHRTRGAGTALRYDPAAGVAHYMSASFASIINVANTSTSKVIIEGIQFRTTATRSAAFTAQGLDVGSYLDGVITVDESSTANNYYWSSPANEAIEARNCIFYTASTDRGRMRCAYTDLTVSNCTFVATAGSPQACTSLEAGPAASLSLYNCVSFGFDAVPTSANTLSVSHCATDLATFPGTSNQTSLTPGDELENVTLASFDGRAKSTGALPDNASTTYAPTLDILGQTRDGTPTIGAYEYLTAGGAVAIAGTMAAVSAVSGAASAARSVAGDIVAASTATASAGVARAAYATLAAASDMAGSLGRSRAVAATMAAISTATGAVVRSAGVSATMAAASTATGALGRSRAIASTMAAASTLSGALSTFAGTAIAGTMAGVSAMSGALSRATSMAGQSASSSTVSGAIIRAAGVAGDMAGTASAVGAIGVRRAVAVVMAGVSALSAALSVSRPSSTQPYITIRARVSNRVAIIARLFREPS